MILSGKIKNSRLIVGGIMVVLAIGVVTVSVNNTCFAKKNVKNIRLKKGETYNLKLKSGNKIKWNNKKVVKVTKKGKITALKKGKCTIKVMKKKKVLAKYNVVVSAQAMTASQYVIVDHVEKINDDYSYVYCVPKDNNKKSFRIQLSDEGVELMKIYTDNAKINELQVASGDVLVYIYSHGVKTKIDGKYMEVTGAGLLYKNGFNCNIESTNAPTPTKLPAPAGLICVVDLKVKKIEIKDEKYSVMYLSLEDKDNAYYYGVSNHEYEKEVKYYKIDVESTKISEQNIVVGDGVVLYLYLPDVKKEIIDDCCVLSGTGVSVSK